MKAWITLILIALFLVPASGQGTLDGDFDADGKLTYDFNGNSDGSYGIAVQPDGKIVVGSYINNGSDFDFFLMRLNSDGSFDNTFSSDGRVNTNIGTDDQGTTVLLQPDGKIILAGISDQIGGTSQFAAVRYNNDGTLDNSFGTAGKVVTSLTNSGGSSTCYGGFIQPDGKIVLTGLARDSAADFNYAVIRYNSDGSLDNTFSVDGKVTTDFGSTLNDQGVRGALQADGKIVLAGIVATPTDFEIGIVRYNSDGTLDNSFGSNGRVQFDITSGDDQIVMATVQSDGKILACGTSDDGTNSLLTVVRLNSDGTLDNSFSSDGVVRTSVGTPGSVAWTVIEQPDGKILAVGYDSSNVAVVRYHTDGSLDTDFGTGGMTTTDFGGNDNGLNGTLQPNGRLVVTGISSTTGNSKILVARYLTGLNIGIEDLSKNNLVMLVYPNPIASSAVFEYELAEGSDISLELQDLQGRVVHPFLNEQRPAGINKEVLHFPTSLASGNYLLHLNTGHGSATVQVTIR